MDEHPDSINDAGFFAPHPTQWVDLVASYHNGSAGLAMADGHSEIKNWLSETTKPNVKIITYGGTTTKANDPDVKWLSYRTPRVNQNY